MGKKWAPAQARGWDPDPGPRAGIWAQEQIMESSNLVDSHAPLASLLGPNKQQLKYVFLQGFAQLLVVGLQSCKEIFVAGTRQAPHLGHTGHAFR